MGQADHHQADDRHADDVLNVDAARKLGEPVFKEDKQANESPGGDPAERAERRECGRRLEPETASGGKEDFRNGEGGIGTDEDAAEQGGRARRNDDRQEGAVRHFGQQNFEGEKHPAERRVESGGDAGAGARSQESDLLSGRQANRLGERRTERRANLDDGPFAPHSGAGANGQRRGERLDDCDDAANISVLIEDRVHHLRDAVALGLGREALHEIHHRETAENRRQDDPVAEPARSLQDIGVIGDSEDAVVHRVVNKADQRPQRDRAKPGHDADPQGEQAEDQQAHPPLVAVRLGERPTRLGGSGGRRRHLGLLHKRRIGASPPGVTSNRIRSSMFPLRAPRV